MATVNYTEELERIIIEVMLPVFEKHVETRGYPILNSEITPAFLEKFRKKKAIPRLFMPKEKQT
jgi:hypothetical protein